MKTRGPASILLVSLALLALLLAPLALAEELEDGRVKGYVPPPTELKKLGEGHWTPYDPPEPPEEARVHTVVRGDTLWDLAKTYYDDNYLWPVIWDANRWVTYSHWIYPGDPLVIPPHPTVVPPEPPVPAVPTPTPEPAPGPGTGEEPGPEPTPEPAPPAGPVLRPVADTSELYCSGLLEAEYPYGQLQIIGREERGKHLLGTSDVVYLNMGLNGGIQPGATYAIVRRGDQVEDPETGKAYGVMVESIGRLEVLAVQQETATAEIVFACDAVSLGDDLIPYEEIPVPLAEAPTVDRYGSPVPAGPTSTVLYARDGQHAAGEGNLLSVGLGSAQGAQPGDTVVFYRERKEPLPRTVLGAGVVLRSGAVSSTVKVTLSWSEIYVGDRAELR